MDDFDKVYEAYERIKTKEDFLAFLVLFRADLEANRDRWENKTLKDFLSAMERYVYSGTRQFDTIGNPIPAHQPSWQLFAQILKGSAVYE